MTGTRFRLAMTSNQWTTDNMLHVLFFHFQGQQASDKEDTLLGRGSSGADP